MNKKIAIVTMIGNNYGACLQAYALQTILENAGYSVNQIQYSNDSNNNMNILGKLKAIGLFGIVDFIKARGFSRELREQFITFRMNNLHPTEKVYSPSNLDEINDNYDYIICGSDMIWSEEFHENWNFYYLGFADSNKSIAYAPSFGKNFISPENEEECRNFLNNFAALSTREFGGTKLVKRLIGKDATHVCDPTLLLKMKDWNELINNNVRKYQDEYCAFYVFGGIDGERTRVWNQIKKSNFKAVFIPNSYKEYKRNDKNVASIVDFVHIYRDSSFVITDTFHGLLFALIFRKPFIVLQRDKKEHWGMYSDRITGILSYLGLEERFCNPETVNITKFLTLDYTNYESKLNEFVNHSRDYLFTALKKVYDYE